MTYLILAEGEDNGQGILVMNQTYESILLEVFHLRSVLGEFRADLCHDGFSTSNGRRILLLAFTGRMWERYSGIDPDRLGDV